MSAFVVGAVPGEGSQIEIGPMKRSSLELFIKYESGCEDSFYPVFDRMVSTLQKIFRRFIFITKKGVPGKGPKHV